MSISPEFGSHPTGGLNSGEMLSCFQAEAERLEAGGLYPESGKSINID